MQRSGTSTGSVTRRRSPRLKQECFTATSEDLRGERASRLKKAAKIKEEVELVISNHQSQDNMPGKGWIKGSYSCKRNISYTRYTWISPTRKIEFKYRVDAFAFESLRQKHGTDEVKAWTEYSNLKGKAKKPREVLDAQRHDEEMGFHYNFSRVKNDPEDKIGKGWTLVRQPTPNHKRKSSVPRYLSPTRKINFRYLMDAQLFESLRQKHGDDEMVAWMEYTKIKHSKRSSRNVLNPEQYDVGPAMSDIRTFRKNADTEIGDNPLSHWEYGTLKRNGKRGYIGIWISPTRKMRFRNRKDAIVFEGLRKKYGADEIEAWVKYSDLKLSNHERREVIACDQYDNINGVGTGRWTESEHKLFVKGLAKFGKCYKKIAKFVGTRCHTQVKSYSKRYFTFEGKIPIEDKTSDSDEDCTGKEEPQNLRAKQKRKSTSSADESSEKPRSKSSRKLASIRKDASEKTKTKPWKQTQEFKVIPKRKLTSSVKRTFSLVDGITNKYLHQSNQNQGGHGKKHLPSIQKNKYMQRSTAPKCDATKRSVYPGDIAKKNPMATFLSLGKHDLHRIASFLPSFQDLVSLTLTSTLTYACLADDTPDEVYKNIFLNKFGDEIMSNDTNVEWSWKERWAKVIGFKKGLRSGITASIGETSVGVLSWEKEEAALFEDNPKIAPIDGVVSKGYTGLKALNNLPKPPNSGKTWEPPLLLHGDFDGIKMFNSVKCMFAGKRRMHLSIGEEYGKVTELVVCNFRFSQEDKEIKPPCCFVGYDSGIVVALTAVLSDDCTGYRFSFGRPQKSHTARVSSMTILDCKPYDDHPGKILMSACHGGQVYYYPNAMNPSCNYDMQSVLAFENENPDLCPLLSIASATFGKNHEKAILVCTGDRDGSMKLWLTSYDFLSKSKHASGDLFDQVKWYKSKANQCVTVTKFINSHSLVSGNVKGDIRLWEVEPIAKSSEDESKVPGLTMRHLLKCAHNGPVETVTNIGDAVITSGGNDGNLVGWDISTGQKIGTISCHYGQETFNESTGDKGMVHSCVVSNIVVNDRLVSLCRDGVLAQWVFC